MIGYWITVLYIMCGFGYYRASRKKGVPVARSILMSVFWLPMIIISLFVMALIGMIYD